MLTKTRNLTTTEYTLMHNKYIITYKCHDNAPRMWKVVQLIREIFWLLHVLSPLLPVVSHFSFVSTWKRSHFSLWFQSSGSPVWLNRVDHMDRFDLNRVDHMDRFDLIDLTTWTGLTLIELTTWTGLIQGSRWRAIRAKKSPCGCSLRFVLVPKEKWKSPCNFTKSLC